MKRFAFMTLILAVGLSLFISSCGNDDIEKWSYKERTCITNKTSYDWHNAAVQFLDSEGKKGKLIEIGAVKIRDYVYVTIEEDYFIVTFTDDKGTRHESEKYYSNPYVDVSFLTK
ncbi:MAG: hypothetical protein IJ197_04490 [Bacteroidaceae bacterium]|nr:hypothetical protein [Bacteroidaceae bacterium]